MKGMKSCRRAKGGSVEGQNRSGWTAKDSSPKEVYAGKDSDVVKEARKRKDGGKVDGDHSMKRLDRKPRKSGGRVGSENSPLSGAAKMSNRPGAKVDDIDD